MPLKPFFGGGRSGSPDHPPDRRTFKPRTRLPYFPPAWPPTPSRLFFAPLRAPPLLSVHSPALPLPVASPSSTRIPARLGAAVRGLLAHYSVRSFSVVDQAAAGAHAHALMRLLDFAAYIQAGARTNTSPPQLHRRVEASPASASRSRVTLLSTLYLSSVSVHC
eukprot:4619634-Pleurochrysis_carterae.AAC.1